MKKRLPPLDYLTPREKRFYNSINNEYPAGHFTIADRTLLCAYSAYHFGLIECRKRLRVDGMTIIGSAGTKVTNPDATFLKHTTALLCSLATKLRLSASTRLLKDHIEPARQKVRNGKEYNPHTITTNGGNTDWKQQRSPNPDWQLNQRDVDVDVDLDS